MRREEHGAPVRLDLGDELVELPLHERVQADRRLVQDQQLRPVHERLYQADLLLVPVGEIANGAREITVESAGQRLDEAPVHAAAQRAEETEQLRAGQVLIESELPGQVPHPAPNGLAVAPAVAPKDAGPAARGTDEVQQRANGGGLAGPVGPEKPEDLPALHLEIELHDAARPPVELRQALGANHRIRHRSSLP